MKLHYGALVFLFEPFDHLGLLGIAALLGVYAGIYVFLRGFRMLQHKRLVLNTPLSKIRSASMGLVEVSGMPKGPQIWNESVIARLRRCCSLAPRATGRPIWHPAAD